jgi:PilZ domain-containing protein
MKRRKPKGKNQSVAAAPEPKVNAAEEASIHRESPVITSPAETHPEVETSESSDLTIELQKEIENFTNSYQVQRHAGLPPPAVKTPPGIEPPPPRDASASTAPLPAAADRRANPRYAFHATAEVAAADSAARTKTRVRDLSQQGCYLDTETPLALGTPANVRMTKGSKSLEVQGRVVYVQPGKGMGLMFTAVKPEHGGTLDAWINESRETSWLANNRRRSQRVLMKIPVRVSLQAGNAALSEEETHTLAVSAHGALLAVSAPLYRGQRLTLLNPQTKDSLECVVAHIDRFPDEQVKVGIEFLLPNPTFWHVAFPPKDWSPRHPHAKSPVK